MSIHFFNKINTIGLKLFKKQSHSSSSIEISTNSTYNYSNQVFQSADLTKQALLHQENIMLLKQKNSGHMIEVTNVIDLLNLNMGEVSGCSQEGEEKQDPVIYKKSDLVFLSGEELPKCWVDPHYRDNELTHSH